MTTRKKMLASASATLLAATGLTLGVSASADAATCYGGAVKFKKEPNLKYVPVTGWLKTTSRCSDINLKLRSQPGLKGLDIKVCFQNGGCQSADTFAKVDEWTVIATDVKDNTTFRFLIKTEHAASGEWAA